MLRSRNKLFDRGDNNQQLICKIKPLQPRKKIYVKISQVELYCCVHSYNVELDKQSVTHYGHTKSVTDYIAGKRFTQISTITWKNRYIFFYVVIKGTKLSRMNDYEIRQKTSNVWKNPDAIGEYFSQGTDQYMPTISIRGVAYLATHMTIYVQEKRIRWKRIFSWNRGKRKRKTANENGTIAVVRAFSDAGRLRTAVRELPLPSTNTCFRAHIRWSQISSSSLYITQSRRMTANFRNEETKISPDFQDRRRRHRLQEWRIDSCAAQRSESDCTESEQPDAVIPRSAACPRRVKWREPSREQRRVRMYTDESEKPNPVEGKAVWFEEMSPGNLINENY